MTARQPLHHEQKGGVDADDPFRPGLQHPKPKIAIATSDVENAVTFQVYMRRHPLPFPVRSPLGFDFHPAQAQWTLAPGVHCHQGIAQCRLVRNHGTQLRDRALQNCSMLGLRQRCQGRLPFQQISVWVVPQFEVRQFAKRC